MEKKTLIYKEALKLLAKDVKREFSSDYPTEFSSYYPTELVDMIDNHVDITKVYIRRAERD